MKRKLICLFALSVLLFGCKNLTIEEQVEKIHDEIVSIDTHTDTPLNFLDPDFDMGKWNDVEKTRTRIDFPRMKAGRLDAAFMAVFVGQGERTDEGNEKAKQKAFEIFRAIEKTVSDNNDQAEIAYSADDVFNIKANDKRAVYIGIENGYVLGTNLSLIDQYYEMGARYITLCHTRNNDICDSSTDEPEHNGLSVFGEKVVRKMNETGMIIDVSHISDSAFYDVLKLTKTPVIASHSSVRALCESPRNLDDEMLKALQENGGVIQICILTDYLKEPEPNPTRDSAFNALREKYNHFQNLTEVQMDSARREWRQLQIEYPKKLANVKDVVDHIDYVRDLIGIDYVGIGTDFDGGGGVEDVIDASEMKNITKEMLLRGYTKDEIAKVWGENFLRVFREVEKTGKEI